MKKADEFFASLTNSIINTLHTSGICKVIASNGSDYTVEPMFKDSEGNTIQPITGVRGLKERYRVNGGTPQIYEPVYQVGDVVQVVFTEHALENVRGNPSKRRHSLTDAIIVGIWG
jgi:hypothetical protein